MRWKIKTKMKKTTLIRMIREEIQRIKEESNEEYAKKQFSDPIERTKWLYAVNLRDKYMSLGKFKKGTSPAIKNMVRKAFNDLDSYRRKQERKSVDFSDALKIIKKYGVNAAKTRGTRIRGYRDLVSPGYELSKDNPRRIEFWGIESETTDKIAKDLEKNGFKIEKYDKPSKAIGGVVGSITLKR